MRAAIIQSNFLPWRGYFDIIREVDVFVLLDDVQYTKRDWRNRNRIKTQHGPKWITAPVRAKSGQAIDEVLVDYEQDWIRRMTNTISQAYSRAPFRDAVLADLESVLEARVEHLSTLNEALLRWVCSRLHIGTELISARTLSAKGAKDDRLLWILRQIGATEYLSGPSAKSYLDRQKFAAAGIDVEFKEYRYPVYEQLHPPYDPYVSIVDLLMMSGPDAYKLIRPADECRPPGDSVIRPCSVSLPMSRASAYVTAN